MYLPANPILSDERQTSCRDIAVSRETDEVHASRHDATRAISAIPAHGMKAPLTRAAFQPPHERTAYHSSSSYVVLAGRSHAEVVSRRLRQRLPSAPPISTSLLRQS